MGRGVPDWIQDIGSPGPKGIGNGYMYKRSKKTKLAPMSELADNPRKSIYSLAFWPARPTVHLIRPLGLDWGAYTSASLPVFLIPLCQLRSKSAGISPNPRFTGERVKHTNFEEMVIRQRILNGIQQRHSSKNLLSHLIHRRLDRGTVILSKGLEGNSAGRLPSSIELLKVCLDLGKASEAAPLPVRCDISAEETIPGLLEGGVLVADETPELGTGALQHGQAVDRGVDVDSLALNHVDLHVASLGARLDERVRVRLAVDVHAHPAVGDDIDVRRVDVAVLLDEVCAQD